MPFFSFVDFVLYPLVSSLVLVFLLLYKDRALQLFQSGKKRGKFMENLNFYYVGVLKSLKLEIGNWRKTIVLPILLAVAVSFAVAWLFQTSLHAGGWPVWLALLTSGFLAPISEEFIYRGIFLAALAIMVESYFQNNSKAQQFKPAAYLTAIILVSLFFVLTHQNTVFYQYIARFSSSILYSLLYLANGKNLFPAIIAHAATNWLLIASDAVNLT